VLVQLVLRLRPVRTVGTRERTVAVRRDDVTLQLGVGPARK